MSDWQVGDLAVCVSNEPCVCCGRTLPAPSVGSVHQVAGVMMDGHGAMFLFLPDAPRGNASDAAHWCEPWFNEVEYRKIRPDEHEACEPEFVTLLKRSRRVGA